MTLRVCGQQAGVDSVHSLPPFEVTTSRLDAFSAGQKVRTLDSLTVQQSISLNLGEVLQRSSAVHINAYTHNGLNTVAFRGTSVTHTGLFWNGFLLNPPNAGQMDLALVPAALFREVRIYHGGGSALFGSGNIGGSLHLNNNVDFSGGLDASAGFHLASFGQAGGEVSVSASEGKWYSRTILTGKTAANDFTYINLDGQEARLENARLLQYGMIQDLYLNAGKGWVTGMSLWLQSNNKEIPATLTSKPSDAWQQDHSARVMLSAKKALALGHFSAKSALLHDYLRFRDPDTIPSLVIDSEIRTLRSVTEAQLEKKVHPNILLNGGAVYTLDRGEVDYYSDPVTQHQLGLFAQWRQEFPGLQWRMNVNLRQDFIQHYRVPFTPAIGLEGKLFWIVSAKASVSRNFRVPTFNDRYWEPGGNRDLLPESSWNEEFSLIFEMNMEAFRNRTWMVFTAYNSNVDNWILWVPDGVLWSARNVQKVWSRGLEAEYRSEFSLGGVIVRFIGGYTYARSTNEAELGSNDNSRGKQLIYVPEHRYFFTGNVLYRGFALSYNHARTGERYVTRDNSESLPGYTIANLVLSKEILISGQQLGLSFQVANLFDKEYQAVQYNPMPGRNYKVSIQFNIKREDHANNEI